MKYSSLASLTLLPVALLLGACASTSDGAADSATVVKAEAPVAVAGAEAMAAEAPDYDPNETVCKRQAVIGSNFKKKICMTRQQWDDMAADSRATTGDIQRRGQSPGRSN